MGSQQGSGGQPTATAAWGGVPRARQDRQGAGRGCRGSLRWRARRPRDSAPARGCCSAPARRVSLGATFGRCRAWRAGVAGSRDTLHALLVSLAGAVVREPKRPPPYLVVVGGLRGPWETRKAGRSGGIVRIADGTVDVLGAHITAGVTWLAPVSRGGGLVADHVDRLELGGGALSEERALSEFEERTLSRDVVVQDRRGSDWVSRRPGSRLTGSFRAV